MKAYHYDSEDIFDEVREFGETDPIPNNSLLTPVPELTGTEVAQRQGLSWAVLPKRPNPIEPSLEEAKSRKKDQIDTETSSAILAGFIFSVEEEDLHFNYDAFDQQNFTDTASACTLYLQGIPNLPETVTWNAYRLETQELVRLVFSATEFLSLYISGALTHKAAQMEIGGQRKIAVDAATTIEEVEAA